MNNLFLKILAAGLILVFSTGIVLAADPGVPDTLYFGEDGKAFGILNGNYKVPVFFTCDEPVNAFNFGMEFGTLHPGVAFDSVSIAASSPEVVVAFELLGFGQYSITLEGTLPDTVPLAAIGNNSLPPGRYKLGDVFFHGAIGGQQIEVDTAYTIPAGPVIFLSGQNEFVPQFVGGVLTLENAPGEFFLISQTTYTGNAGYEIPIVVEVYSSLPVAAVVVDSIVNAVTGDQIASDSLPAVVGTNPASIPWIPGIFQYGIWNLYVRIIDTAQYELPLTIKVTVNQLPNNCDPVRGDVNCDGVLSLGDAVGLIQYLFGGGSPPGCSQ